MGYHYDPLLALFDGWILVLLTTLGVMAGVRLRGGRRLFTVGGFGLWALATALWLPPILGKLYTGLEPVVGTELAQQAPLLPWLAGALLLTAGILLPARPTKVQAGPAYPPPTTSGPPAPPPMRPNSESASSNRSPPESREAR